MKKISRFEKIFVLGLVLSLFTLHYNQADTSLFLEKTSGKGHLRIQNGIPVLYLYGTPEEIGTQYGDILKSHVRVLMNEWLRPMYPEEKNWDKAIADAKALEPLIPEAYRLEMRATARASGVVYEELLVAHTFTETSRMDWMFLCSGVIVYGDATADGTCYHGRNFDFPSRGLLTPRTLVIVYHPRGKIPFVSIGVPGIMGVVTGMNEKGISLSTNYIIGKPKGNGIPMMFLYRMILEQSDSVEEAILNLKKATRSGANNLLLASEKQGVVCEYTKDDVIVRTAEKDLVYATNHFRRIESPAPCPRYAAIGRLVKAHYGDIGPAHMKTILQETALGGLNCQAIILEPGEQTIHVAITDVNPAAHGPYRKLTSRDMFDVPPAAPTEAPGSSQPGLLPEPN